MMKLLKMSTVRISFLFISLGYLRTIGAPLDAATLLDGLPFAMRVEVSIQGRIAGFKAEVREAHLRVIRDALEALTIYGQNHPESNALGWKKDNASIALKKMFFILTDRDTAIIKDPLKSALAGIGLNDDVLPIPNMGRFRSVFVPDGAYSMMQYFVLGLRLDNCLFFPGTSESRPDAFARTVSRLANTLLGQATPFLTDDPLQQGARSMLAMSAWAAVTTDSANEKEWEFLGWLLQQEYLDARYPGQRRYLQEQREKALGRINAATIVEKEDCAPHVADVE